MLTGEGLVPGVTGYQFNFLSVPYIKKEQDPEAWDLGWAF